MWYWCHRDYIYVYPTSIWVPTREVEFEQVCIPLEAIKKAHGFDLIIDDVEHIVAKQREVHLRERVLSYDYLVVAMGAHKVQHSGIQHTLSICGDPKQSLKIRERIDMLMARGSGKIAMGFGGNPKDPSGVRGGPAFELLFNVHNLLLKKGIRQQFDLTFFAPMAEPGKRMGPQALKLMNKLFIRLNIDRRFGQKIKEFTADGIVFADGSKLPSDLTMFIAANAGHRQLAGSDLPLTEAGFIKIDDYCRVEGFERVYAVGDVANLEGPDWRAKQGHIAEVMARNTAFNIAAQEQGSDRRKGYIKHLNILCVMDSGDGAAFVYRDDTKAMMIPMPVVGHWLKKGWGWYYRNSKLGRIPRIPGM
jgi:sulfide:quinone oxidoreductase